MTARQDDIKRRRAIHSMEYEKRTALYQSQLEAAMLNTGNKIEDALLQEAIRKDKTRQARNNRIRERLWFVLGALLCAPAGAGVVDLWSYVFFERASLLAWGAYKAEISVTLATLGLTLVAFRASR